ncbi:arrestin domain-containing protein 3-like isoform X2 [Colossoma macropomum]|uniref:arrestin domain-containing protein 3-like isoform X2 n=1 Tax=Colossoma macropomum TaxID=42526 RepID=UPI00186565CC|nr:arrestin domain-containing protein 3-like isoform X2 [Colossoma macropomum]
MIKELTLNYDAVNETNTFTNGNIVQGRVFLEVIKEVKISFFYIKCKGDADVNWSTGGEDGRSYHAHERYFKLKQIFIQKDSKQGGNVVRPGSHVFPFSFQLPSWNLPPSFEGSYGSIKYVLEVRLYHLSGKNCTVKTKLTSVPRISSGGALLMCPQIAATEKKMKVFGSGSASIRTTIDKMGYIPGDVIKVSANVDNSSSREVKLEFSLKQKQIFTAEGAHTSSSKTIFSVVGRHIPSGSKQTINTDLKIPPNLELSVTNCTIIKAEYILKVRLIIPYAKDLMMEFPLVILHASQLCTLQPSVQLCGIPDESRRSNPAPQAAFGPNPPPQAAFGPNPPPQAAFGPNPPPQAASGPIPPGAASGPAPGLHPSPYPSPANSQPANPESPPPCYTDIYPQLSHKF